MKHNVLSHYLDPWAKIRGTYNEQLNYIDGFGGIGAYHTANDVEQGLYLSNHFGSPVFSVEAIYEQQKLKRIKRVSALVIDTDQKNLDNLKLIFEQKKLPLPNFICGDFDTEINKILNVLKKKLYPTFFLLDPFGFSQVKFRTVKRIMTEFDNTEIVITFMYNSINRFLEDPKLETIYNDLFGCTDWKKFVDSPTQAKERALVTLFRDQCKKAGAKYVYPYKLNFPEKNRPYYYLFHLCNHHLGTKIMKEIFARENDGEVEYSGQPQNPNLFDEIIPSHERGDKCPKCYIPNSTVEGKCIDCFRSKFGSREITYRGLLQSIIDEVPWTERGIRTALQDFEKRNEITVKPSSQRKRKRKNGFQEDDVIMFTKKS